MKTWSLGDVMDVFKRVEQITRPPRRPNHDADDYYDPTADTSMCDCGHQVRFCECPINDEPGLTDDDLVGVRHMLAWWVNHQVASADGSAQGPADGPAGGVTHSPESSPAGVPLATWLEPAIWTALTDHQPSQEESAIDGIVYCWHPSTEAFEQFGDWQEWREHVSPDITQRIAAALPDFQK